MKKDTTGQSGVFFMVIAMMIIVGVIIAFFTFQSNLNKYIELSSKDYIHNYGASMLLTFLRSSTGNPQPDCSKVSDLIFKMYSSPPDGKCCGIEDKTCKQYATDIMNKKWQDIMSKAKKGYIYYLEINKPQSNLGTLYSAGDIKVKNTKIPKYVIRQDAIPSHNSYVEYPYAELYIIDKRELMKNEE